MSTIQLLAPAGQPDCVKAAVRCGADAIYLGLESFSARVNAKNFSKTELLDACSYCNARGVSVFLALNTVVFDDEIELLIEQIKIAADCGVDAFIVQDLAVASLAKSICPTIPIHASTQLTAHTVHGVKQLEKLGFTRVVLSRELTLDEIKVIAENTSAELEVFVHGALCMSVSGQCYFSAMLGSRSGNRGECAGTCRLPFSGGKNDHSLSLKDLCAVNSIAQLKEIGVKSFKIEGRMKRPEYVAAAVTAYRKTIDREETNLADLRSVFSRNGFTNGYLENKIDADMFGFRDHEDVTAASSVLKPLRNLYNKERKSIPITFSIAIFPAKPISATISDGQNIFFSEGVIPSPSDSALSETFVKSAIDKLGDTPFFLDSIDVYIGTDVSVPRAELNELRRVLVGKLLDARSKITPRKTVDTPLNVSSKNISSEKKATSFYGRFEKIDQISDTIIDSFEYIIVPIGQLLKSDKLDPISDKIIMELPRVMFGSEPNIQTLLTSAKNRGFSKIFANNIAHIDLARQVDMEIFGGPFLNIANSISTDIFSSLGAKAITLSPEIIKGKCRDLSIKTQTLAMVYGRLPLMILRNCPLKSGGGCSKCAHHITDRRSEKFPLLCNQSYVEVLNVKPIYLADKLTELDFIGGFLLYFTTESKQQCEKVLSSYIDGKKPHVDFTRGFLFRQNTSRSK